MQQISRHQTWKVALTTIVMMGASSGVLAPIASAATTTTVQTNTAATVKADMSSAVNWMDANAAAKMPAWTAVATFAATGQFANVKLPQDYVSGLKTSTDYAKAILGVLADGQDPHNFEGVNLVAKLSASQLSVGDSKGKFADNIDKTGTDLLNNQSWAIIALQDAGSTSYNQVAAATWLIAQQNKDGGFGYSVKYNASDADDTAAAIVALRLLGYASDSAPIEAALAYLKTQQVADGGIVNGSTTSNSDSTGVTIDALASLGMSPLDFATTNQADPLTSLLAEHDAKSGGFNFDNTGNSWSGVSDLSTRDAILGLAAAENLTSVYQRLESKTLNQLNPYWQKVYAQGGAWLNHQWVSWPELRSMAIAGSYVSDLTPTWQQVVNAHGEWVTQNGAKTWTPWGPSLATQALAESFGLNTLHLNLIG